jgi:hypothetical protein
VNENSSKKSSNIKITLAIVDKRRPRVRKPINHTKTLTDGISRFITDHLPTHYTKKSLNHTEYDEIGKQNKSFFFENERLSLSNQSQSILGNEINRIGI